MDYKKFDSINKIRFYQLRENDVFLYKGEPYAFIKKQRRPRMMDSYTCRAINLNTGQHWKLYFSYGDGLDHVGTYEPQANKMACQPTELQAGELFTLLGRKQTELWRFERFDGSKVHAINPITNRRVSIGEGFEFVKISNLPY